MEHSLVISNSNELYRLFPADIIYLEADRNYTHIFVAGGHEIVVVRQLGELEKMMAQQLQEDASQFARLGRGVMVNLNYIFSINLKKQQLVLKDDLEAKLYKLSVGKDILAWIKRHIEDSVPQSVEQTAEDDSVQEGGQE